MASTTTLTSSSVAFQKSWATPGGTSVRTGAQVQVGDQQVAVGLGRGDPHDPALAGDRVLHHLAGPP
ncbi:MAG TPA: hypothetical protein VHA34_06890, partial [Actinomycetes bacterium]|nr:hypothetical protein [Actinomycetes bacterium]